MHKEPTARPRRLVLLCDVSDSVRNVSRFMLELAYVSQELFARTLTIAQDTALRNKRRALGRALAAGVGAQQPISSEGRKPSSDMAIRTGPRAGLGTCGLLLRRSPGAAA